MLILCLPSRNSKDLDIYEQYMSVMLGLPVTMIMPASAKRSLIDALETGKEGFNCVNQALTNIDAESCRAFSLDDEVKVRKPRGAPDPRHGRCTQGGGADVGWE